LLIIVILMIFINLPVLENELWSRCEICTPARDGISVTNKTVFDTVNSEKVYQR